MSKNLFLFGWLIALALSACTGRTAVPTTTPIPTNTLPPTGKPAFSAVPDEHSDPVNAPDHIHLDDGSTAATGNLPIEDELLAQLLSGDPVAVGAANASAQTVALTIPTMF